MAMLVGDESGRCERMLRVCMVYKGPRELLLKDAASFQEFPQWASLVNQAMWWDSRKREKG